MEYIIQKVAICSLWTVFPCYNCAQDKIILDKDVNFKKKLSSMFKNSELKTS